MIQPFYSPDPEPTSASQERMSQDLNNFQAFQIFNHLNMCDNHQYGFNLEDLGGTLPRFFNELNSPSFASALDIDQSFGTSCGDPIISQHDYAVEGPHNAFMNPQQFSVPNMQGTGENWTRLVALITPIHYQRLTVFQGSRSS